MLGESSTKAVRNGAQRERMTRVESDQGEENVSTRHSTTSPTVESYSVGIADYSLFRPNVPSSKTIIFVPGMACNRYGHPFDEQPKHAVKEALFDIAVGTYNIVFPDIHQMARLRGMDELPGSTVEQQTARLSATIEALSPQISSEQILFVGQSLGCLTIAALARDQMVSKRQTRCVLWGPPTYEGIEHRRKLVSMFAEREKTYVDEKGQGYVQFGNGRLMCVGPEYWASIDRASLREHWEAMTATYSDITAFCASIDSFYTNNWHYVARHMPGVVRIEIPGSSHTFKPDEMKWTLRVGMEALLSR